MNAGRWCLSIALPALLTSAAATPAAAQVIPLPRSITPGRGVFRIDRTTTVAARGAAREAAGFLIAALAPAMGWRLELVEEPAGDRAVILSLDSALRAALGDEGYRLRVAPERVDLRAAGPAGLFYGVQTIRQLLPPQALGASAARGIAWNLPCLSIEDAPRFAWRGLLIDPARHFIPPADLLRFLDAMALLKLNRLQIHLSDNRGWRLEIKRYPRLTEIGARMDRSGGRGGYYAQEEIRRIVAHAAERHITIVPEIEMPAHTGAAIASYPQLGLEAEKIAELPPQRRWGEIKCVLAPTPATVRFMQGVLSEVLELFPSAYIHIGGDEANTAYWKNSAQMQALMKRLDLADVHALHSWFIGRMDAFLSARGRHLIGWDEILQGGLAPGAAVMSWRGMAGGIAAARAGHDVVMAPTSHTYFDYYQGPKASEPRAIGGFLPLEQVYRFEPLPEGLTDPQARHILGGQGQLWGEFISTREHREYMAFPRACALSEVLWSPRAQRNGPDFLARLKRFLEGLRCAGIGYRPLDPGLTMDRPVPVAGPFEYFANNWNVIGLKDYQHGTRITPDNALQLADKQLVRIRLGRELRPLGRAHLKLAQEGWMPILEVAAAEGPVRYEVTLWATPLPDVGDWLKAFDGPSEGENFLNWIRVEATNTSDAPAEARIEIAPEAGAGGERGGIARHAWKWDLAPRSSAIRVARYPFFPLKESGRYESEDAQKWLERTREYWRGAMARAAHIEVPSTKANQALLAAHVCQLIAADHGEVHGGEGFYDTFYIRDGAYQVMELEEAGMGKAAARALESYLGHQRPDGRFESQKGQLDANGQAVWVLWQYHLITGDRAFLERVYPRMLKAVRWTMAARREAPPASPFAGLLPAAPADGEFLWGGHHHIVGYDLWNLRGMVCTADAARELGKDGEERELRAEIAAYRAAIDRACQRSALAYFPPSWEKAGTHWGNTETLWPTELFARDDPRVAALSRHLREDFAGGYIEGTIQWKGGGEVQAIHPYMGAYTTMSDLARGRGEQVVEDFFWYLLHTSAANAFPEGIYYRRRVAWGDTIPHVTGACNYAILLRHMLVHEAGDELHLLAAVPDWWLGDGKTIRIERAPTHFGELTMVVRGGAEGVALELSPPARRAPRRIVVHLPRSRKLLGTPPGVALAYRPDQSKRWDLAAVQNLYGRGNLSFEPDAPSLTTGKPASCSHALPSHPARLANDGFAADTDRYWATDVRQHPGAAWWQVDLGEPQSVGRVVVVGYYGDRRSYGFTVETSLDGKNWEMVADQRRNKELSTRAGTTCRFTPRLARYLRVSQTSNSANTGRHLVEVMAFAR